MESIGNAAISWQTDNGIWIKTLNKSYHKERMKTLWQQQRK